MTREEFTQQWSPNDSFRNVCSFATDLDSLLSATRKAALDEVWNLADAHCCDGYYCNCRRNIKAAIRALIDQPKEEKT